MTGLVIAGAMKEQSLPGALFASPASVEQFSPDRRAYEAAVRTYAKAASPAAIKEAMALARRYGFPMTRAEARDAAVLALRESLSALGYGEADILWHAARRGRCDHHLFVA